MRYEVIARPPSSGAPVRSTPLLFVHGSWHAAWCWDVFFLPFFANAGYPVRALSLRGHGLSDGRHRLGQNRLWDYVADVLRGIEQLPVPPVLIGHSLGGAIVQKYLELPGAPPVAGAVLMASVPPHGVWKSTLRLMAGRHFFAAAEGLIRRRLYPLVATPARAHDLLFSPAMPRWRAASYQARLQDESFLAFVDTLFANLPRPARARTPVPPVLVLGGNEDKIVRPAEVEATAHAWGTTSVPFPSMANDLMLDPGWEDVAKRVLEWLDEQNLAGTA